MKNYIILDLEATCWAEKKPTDVQEIIEIGAIKINENQQVVGEFCQFVKPSLQPVLSDFCMQLTTIRQQEVDQTPHFPEALRQFRDWIGPAPYVLCSWGFYDKNQLAKDCQRHGLDTTWLEPHISLKHQHAEIRRFGRSLGMATALQTEGLPLDGTHHRGIDDARNIAKIFLKYFNDWKV